MVKTVVIQSPTRPFVLFSMGIDGYKGEEDVWDLADSYEPNVYRILVRIKHEMSR